MSPSHHTRSPITRFVADTRGAALVEFAITFPLMVFLFAVIIEGSRMMWDYQSAITGVRDATRYVARVVPSEICATATSGDSLASYLPTTSVRVSPFSRVTPDLIAAVLECQPGSGMAYRNDPAPVVVLSATLTIQFPFGNLFGLIGASLDDLTTVVTDQSRIYGS